MADEETKEQTNGTVTQEEFDRLKAELEATRPLQEQFAALGETIKARDAEIATHTANTQALQEKLTAAVAEFKTLVLSANPLYTQELIAGASIEELKASADKANALIAKVREGLEKSNTAEAAATTIPAGAPGRKGPDIGSMSAAEKINYGLEQARRKK